MNSLERKIAKKFPLIINEKFDYLQIRCAPIRLHQEEADKMKIDYHQLLIMISIRRISKEEDELFSKIKNEINEYIANETQYKQLVPISFMVPMQTIYDNNLYIAIPLPELISIEKYYDKYLIPQIENEFHQYETYLIRSFFKHTSQTIPPFLFDDNLSLGLIYKKDSPFPQLKLTPLYILNKYLSLKRIHVKIQQQNKKLNDENNQNNSSQEGSNEKMIDTSNERINEKDERKIKQHEEYEKLKELMILDNYPEQTAIKLLDIQHKVGNYYMKPVSFTSCTTIHQGKYGTVQRAKNNQGEKIVLKHGTKEQASYIKNEAMILSLCKHPNIVKYYGYKETSTPIGKSSYLFIENCDYDLAQFLELRKRMKKPLSTSQIKSIFKQMVEASKYLYETFGIVHRDIKLENYLITSVDGQMIVKLADFGFARKCTNHMFNYVGTPYYSAPEVLQNIPYSYKSEMFSLGICLYYLIHNKFPFTAQSHKDLIRNYVQHSQMKYELPNEPELINLCQKCLKYDANERCSFEELTRSSRIVL